MPKISAHMLSDMERMPAVQLGDFTLQIELDEPSAAMREVARKELRETQKLVQPAVDQLRRLLSGEGRTFISDLAKQLLILQSEVLIDEDTFGGAAARAQIKRHYSFKVKHHKFYDGLMPSLEQNIFKQDILTVLPNRDQHGRRIIVIELGKKWKTNKCCLDELFKGCVLFLEAAVLEPETQIAGAVIFVDVNGLSLQQVWQFTPEFVKRMADWLQDTVPLRIKGVYIVNQPYIFNMVFALCKPFLREKLRSRIHFLGSDWKALHEHISAKCLSERYGGTVPLPRVTGNQWLELLLMYEQEYRAINSYGYKK